MRNSFLKAVTAGCFATILVVAHPARADKNIFDDDWVPPQRKADPATPIRNAPPRTVPADPKLPPRKNPVQPVQPVQPGPIQPAPIRPVLPQPPATPAVLRSAIPDSASQAASRKLMREVYAEQLTDRTANARATLSAKLLQDSATARSNPADCFVLLTGALEAAKESGRLPLCLSCAQKLAENFPVDPVAIKIDLAATMRLAESPAPTASENLSAGLDLFDDLLAHEAFAEATRLATMLTPLARNSVSSRVAVQARTKDIAYWKTLHERLPQQEQKLQASPGDPEASLAVGRYYCFARGDWEAGVALLAAGSNASLKNAANLERQNPSTPQALKAAADAWWEASEREGTSPAQTGMKKRAVFWYRSAIDAGLTGLAKTAAEKRIASAGDIAGKSLPNMITSLKGPGIALGADGTILIPRGGHVDTDQRFKPSVAFHIELQLIGKDLRLVYAANQIIFDWEMNADELRIDGGPANGRHKRGAGMIPVNQWTAIDLVVQPAEIIIRVDGQERYRMPADFSKVDQTFGIRAHGGDVRVRTLTVEQGR
jgi:hypothetical protein